MKGQKMKIKMRWLIKEFIKIGGLLILLAMAISACTKYAEHEIQPTNIPATSLSNPTVTAGAVVAEVTATSTSPITKQEIIEMWDSVDNFASVINRLDGLTADEKQTLITYISQEIKLSDEFQKNCSASLTTEERTALKDRGNPLYQQANTKFNDAIINDPDCSKSSQDLNNLVEQNGDLIIKVKMLLSPYM